MPARFMRVSWSVLLVTAMALFASKGAAEPSAQDREQARSLMDLGDEKTAAGDHEAALKAYQAADAIMGVPTTGIEVGKALEKLGRLVEARDAYVRVTRYPARSGESATFTNARDTAAQSAEALGRRIPSLTLKITGLPDGTSPEVSLDGTAVRSDLLGLPLKVNPGARRVTATAPGFLPIEQEVTLAEGGAEQLELAFQPDPSAPAAPSEGPAGDAAPDAEQGVSTADAPSRTLMWIGFGVGAAGIVAGSVTGVMSLSRASAAKDQCDGSRCPPEAEDEIDSSKTLGNISNIAFAVGVVGIGVGVWQLLATSSGPTEQVAVHRAPKLRVEPTIAFNRIGVRGSF